MHVKHAPGAGLFVKIVDVLRAKKETRPKFALEFRKSQMGRIRLGGERTLPAHRIEFPDEARIAPPCLGRRNFLETKSPPEAARVAKGGDAALGADAGAGENENSIVWPDVDHVPIMPSTILLEIMLVPP